MLTIAERPQRFEAILQRFEIKVCVARRRGQDSSYHDHEAMSISAVRKLVVDALSVQRRMRAEHGDQEGPSSSTVRTEWFNEGAVLDADGRVDQVEQRGTGRAKLKLSLLQKFLAQVLLNRLKSHGNPVSFAEGQMIRVHDGLDAPRKLQIRRE